jgi:hypothetical protein
MQSLVDSQKDHFLKQIADVNKDFSVEWITENPTTQLTSSFNPIIEDPKLWYGDLYLELGVVKSEKPKKTSKK